MPFPGVTRSAEVKQGFTFEALQTYESDSCLSLLSLRNEPCGPSLLLPFADQFVASLLNFSGTFCFALLLNRAGLRRDSTCNIVNPLLYALLLFYACMLVNPH